MIYFEKKSSHTISQISIFKYIYSIYMQACIGSPIRSKGSVRGRNVGILAFDYIEISIISAR